MADGYGQWLMGKSFDPELVERGQILPRFGRHLMKVQEILAV
jgi:hypothetical protein